jgi:glycosyltransferase involved in cell wall biosynthesis
MIVSDIGGNAEAVVDGKTGFVVPPADPAAISAALLCLAQDPALRRTFGEAGRERVATNFTLDECVAKYRALYDELLAPWNKRASKQAKPIQLAL